ncbi:hypothetical protein SCUCBS95973_006130 [Sporothrix curviconia]|uniref:WD repeat protein n=1 Tax=Sporothrix curviconia TaxID=1260050 RepID=A0ABP0C3J0_9PEZI
MTDFSLASTSRAPIDDVLGRRRRSTADEDDENITGEGQAQTHDDHEDEAVQNQGAAADQGHNQQQQQQQQHGEDADSGENDVNDVNNNSVADSSRAITVTGSNSSSRRRLSASRPKRARTDGSQPANSDSQMVSPHIPSAVNGSAPLQNGKDKAPIRQSSASQTASASRSAYRSNGLFPTYYGHDREEITRLLMQTLTDLGYNDAAASVSENSGLALESQAVADFRRAVLTGEWSEAERLLLGPSSLSTDALSGLGGVSSGSTSAAGSAEDLSNGAARSSTSLNGQAPSDTSGGLLLVPGADRDLMRFGIRQQKSNFPTHVLCELDSNIDEVWQVRFSHDGRYLASCGLGRYVNIYEVSSFKLKMRLDGHTQGAGDIAWSPDDSMLVSCGRDGCARLWDMNTGLLIRLFEQFDEPISGCVWSIDHETLVLGSFDKDRALVQYKFTGERSYTWTRKHRTEALAMSPDGLWLVAMDHEKHLHVYNYFTQELEYDMELDSRAVSIAISQDSQFLLVFRQDGEIHMYNIRARGGPVRKYIGAMVGECVVRATFGGADESFVISGSEDGNLNIWHKNLGAHLFRLEAHKPRCNAIAWSPTDPCLFATCGDDGKIKFWSSSDRVRQRDAEAAQSNGASNRGSNGWRPDLSTA